MNRNLKISFHTWYGRNTVGFHVEIPTLTSGMRVGATLTVVLLPWKSQLSIGKGTGCLSLIESS
jgi:hypothetical protein